MKANRDPFTGYAAPPIVPCYKDDQGRLWWLLVAAVVLGALFFIGQIQIYYWGG